MGSRAAERSSDPLKPISYLYNTHWVPHPLLRSVVCVRYFFFSSQPPSLSRQVFLSDSSFFFYSHTCSICRHYAHKTMHSVRIMRLFVFSFSALWISWDKKRKRQTELESSNLYMYIYPWQFHDNVGKYKKIYISKKNKWIAIVSCLYGFQMMAT